MLGSLSRWYMAAALAFSAVAGVSAIAALHPQQAIVAVTPEDAEFFEARIRPVLIENCQQCHGDAKQAGGLRLDTRANVEKGAVSGAVVVAGKPEQSRLVAAIEQAGSIKMPPGGKLKPKQIADLTEWVRRGAPWPEARKREEVGIAIPAGAPYVIKPEQKRFWSFQPVKRPAVPAIRHPQSVIRNPIDAFILAGLERKGLTMALAADRRTLIRRAAYDLTGLPPTPQEVDAFLADKSPNAWGKVIDRLLASPRYGERWGRHWLDLVRYCDSLDSRSLGSEGDVSEAWKYRDWVIDAFNSDLPYMDFIVQQIAGDLADPPPGPLPRREGEQSRTISLNSPAAWKDYRLPNASGIIATSLLSIGNWGNGDADKDKILTDIADDQVDVVSRTFMGLTMACARCHNHKFDPLSAQDYYGLAGIFFSTHILAKLTPKGAGENIMKVPLFKPELVEARKKHAADLASLEQRYNAAMEDSRRSVAAAIAPETARYLTAAWEYRAALAKQPGLAVDEFAGKQGLRAYALRQWLEYQGPSDFVLLGTPIRDVLGSKGVHGYRGAADTPSLVVNTNKEARQLLTFTLPPRSVSIHPGPATGVAALWSSPVAGTVKVTGRVADADPAGGDGIAWTLALRASNGLRTLASGGFENGGMQAIDAVGSNMLNALRVVPGDRIELQVFPKASHTCDTTVVELRIDEAGGKSWDLTKDVLDSLHEGGNPHPDSYGNSGVWRFVDMANRAGATLAPDAATAFAKWRELLAKAREEDRPAVADAAKRFAAGFRIVDSTSPFWPTANEAESALSPESRAAVSKLSTDLATMRVSAPPPLNYANGALEGGVPESPHAGVHDVRVHLRGRYDRLAERVPRRFPTILAGVNQPPITQGSGRLELARWIATEKHPLTARVLVNRVWQHHFGEGIVRTPSNFGFLGERPTNPELLDWLAAAFVAKDESSGVPSSSLVPHPSLAAGPSSDCTS